ncbi:MAG TPA: alpha-galactosidase [Trueperaceae bacterium]|nr:alpha-galactosidase [Trueperaceae bacterium]
MPKVTIIGAGSAVFAAEIMRDVLASPYLPRGTFALVDIDERRLDVATRMAEWLVRATGRDWQVEASTDRATLLSGSDYVVNSIEVAGPANVRHDYDIPLKYGVDQCIGDTSGPGGLFKALRTLPVWLEILRDVERLAPRALVMNYTNPMSLTVLTAARASSAKVVGLCHSVQHTTHQLADYLDVPYEELDWQAAGINHLAWVTRLERDGRDLYPLLKQRLADVPGLYDRDPVRFEMMRELGAFVTESSGHTSEYTAYFRKRPDLIERYMRPGYLGESGFYANNWPRWRQEALDELERTIAGQSEHSLERGPEYASRIIDAVETGRPTVIYGNVLNTGLIDNLPSDGVVEVACLVDRKGVQPTHFGPLPTQLANLDRQHMAFHDLVATAVIEEDREAAVHALMTDPLTAAVCSLAEIRALFDEMALAQKEHLPAFLNPGAAEPRAARASAV